MEAVESMEMASGSQSPSRQGAGTGTSDPRNLSSVAAGLRDFSWNMTLVFRVLDSEAKYGRKGEVGGRPRAHTMPRHGPGPGRA